MMMQEVESWWKRCTGDQLAFLAAYGFVLDAMSTHHRGYYVRFVSRHVRLALEFDPELETLEAAFRMLDSPDKGHVRIWNLLGSRDATTDYAPHRGLFPSAEAFVCSTVALWSRGLQDLAQDVLRGEVDGDIPWSEDRP
jgi:hypothetical protein